jgi:hypothetical protein
LSSKGQRARCAIDSENGHVVGALIAAVEEPAGGIEREASRVISSRPLVCDESERTIDAD